MRYGVRLQVDPASSPIESDDEIGQGDRLMSAIFDKDR